MRKLTTDSSQDPIVKAVLLVLQFRTTKEPFLPNLRAFECKSATEEFIPFIPSLLSHKTTLIDIEFAEDSSMLVVASMVARLPILCPDVGRIHLNGLPEHPLITEAVSDMLLGCNRDALWRFYVDSPLTEEAHNVLFQLPKLSILQVVVQGHTLLPLVALPNLFAIRVEFDDHLDWLQGFRGAMLRKLEQFSLSSESEKIGDVLGEFKNVALTTSAPATLRGFYFNTSRSWNPSYRSLLPFTQLVELVIEFSCEDGCSSRVDDDIIIDLVQTMPKLRVLQLGRTPCETRGGITIKGLIALAGNCHLLSKLRIHFQTDSLIAAARHRMPAPPDDKPVVLWQDCALTDLEVGEIPIPEGEEAVLVTIALLQIFPDLRNIEFTEENWEDVLVFIKAAQRLGSFIQDTSKIYFPYIRSYLVTFCQTTNLVSGLHRNNVFRRFWMALTLLRVTPSNLL